MTKVIPHNWISRSRGPYYNQRTTDNPRLSVTNIFYIWDEPCHEENPIQTLAFSALHNWTFSTFHNWDRTCHEANPIQTLASQLFHNTHTARSPYPRITPFTHYHTLILSPSPFAKKWRNTKYIHMQHFHFSLPDSYQAHTKHSFVHRTPKTP